MLAGLCYRATGWVAGYGQSSHTRVGRRECGRAKPMSSALLETVPQICRDHVCLDKNHSLKLITKRYEVVNRPGSGTVCWRQWCLLFLWAPIFHDNLTQKQIGGLWNWRLVGVVVIYSGDGRSGGLVGPHTVQWGVAAGGG